MGADPSPGVGAPQPAEQPVYRAELSRVALGGLGILIVGIVLVITAIDRAQQLLGLVVLAAVLAAVVGSLIERIGNKIGRVSAAVLIHIVLLLAIAASTTLVIQQIRVESAALEDYATAQLEDLGDGGAPGILSRANLSQRVGDAVSSWGTIAVVGDDVATGIAARLSQLLIVIVLSAFFTLRSSHLLGIAVSWVDDRDRRRVLRQLWTDSVDGASRYLRRSLVVASCSGLAAAGVAAAFGLPGVLLLGVWAGLLTMVPLLGTPVGWLPVAALAMINLPTDRALPATALCVAAVAIVSLLRAKIVIAPVHPGSFIVAIGIAVGLAAAGLPGAAAGLFVAVALAVAASHQSRATRSHAPDEAVESRTNGYRRVGPTVTAIDDRTVEPVMVVDGYMSLRLSKRTALQIAALIIGAFMVQLAFARVGPILVWAVVGILIAVGLDRPVTAVERRLGMRRSLVVIAGAILVAVLLVALVASTRGQLHSTASVDDELPTMVAELEDLPLIGPGLARMDLDTRISELEREAPRFLDRSPMAGRAVGLVGGGIVGFFWVATTALTALLDGPRLVAAVDRRVPARLRRQTSRLARSAQGALAGYVAGSALVALINAALIASMALVVGAPMPLVLALWAFTWNFIPQIGAIIGWVPLLVLAFAAGPVAGGICLLIFVVYQALENNLIQPTIVGQAVNISALAALGAALFGAAVGGLLGAVLAIPIVGVARAMVTEYRRDDFPRLRTRSEAVRYDGAGDRVDPRSPALVSD